MNDNRKIKSHEYISKVVLKGFAFRDERGRMCVKYLKMPKTRIHHGDIRKFNTRFGAYSTENEEILDQEFETYLGELQARIRTVMNEGKIGDKNDKFFEGDFDKNRIKAYFAYQCIRDDSAVRKMVDINNKIPGLDFLKKLNIDANAPILSIKNNLIAEEFRTKFFKSAFADDYLVIGISRGGNLLGSSYIVNLSPGNEKMFLGLAISKHIIFMLVDDGPWEEDLILKYRKFAWKELDLKTENLINSRTIEIGKNRVGGYVISDSEEKIKRYL